MGTSIRPVRLTMPVRAKTAVPGLAGRAQAAEPVGAHANDARDVGVALDVVDVAGWPKRPATAG